MARKAKTKRKRGRRRAQWDRPPSKGWHLQKKNGSLNTAALEDWLQGMSWWGYRVRDDILRLEKHLKLAAGDPGDPPPPPEE